MIISLNPNHRSEKYFELKLFREIALQWGELFTIELWRSDFYGDETTPWSVTTDEVVNDGRTYIYEARGRGWAYSFSRKAKPKDFIRLTQNT